MGRGISRSARALLGIAVGTAAFVTAGIAPASAASVSPVCDAYLSDANGNPTGGALSTDSALPALTIPDFSAPATAEVSTAFNVVGGGNTVTLPKQATVTVGGNPLTVNVQEVKNIKLVFETTGAESIGVPNVSGGTVVNPSAVVNGDKLTLTLPGEIASGSVIPGGGAYFAPQTDDTFTVPTVTIPVTAPASPGTIETTLLGITLMVKVDILPQGILLTKADTGLCTGSALVNSIDVVNPPPPPENAPDAVNDAATTDKNTAVNVAVLDNDTPDEVYPIDTSSLAIIEEPTSGTAVVEADGTITYTPNDGFTGVDRLRYQLCSLVEQEVPRAIAPQAQVNTFCDTALVSVTVNDEVVVTTTTTVAVAATTTPPTTAAAAAAAPAPATLPVTGDASGPLAISGAALLALGLAFVRRGRRAATIR